MMSWSQFSSHRDDDADVVLDGSDAAKYGDDENNNANTDDDVRPGVQEVEIVRIIYVPTELRVEPYPQSAADQADTERL